METGEGIKKFRDRKRFNTQTDLAKTLDINPQNVSMWEAGKGFPSFQIAKKLLELGATVEELFGVEYMEKHYREEIKALENEKAREQEQKELHRIIKENMKTSAELAELMIEYVKVMKMGIGNYNETEKEAIRQRLQELQKQAEELEGKLGSY